MLDRTPLTLTLALLLAGLVSGCNQSSDPAPTTSNAPAPSALPEPSLVPPTKSAGGPSPTTPTVAGAPNIEFASLIHDFGDMMETEERTASVKFTNTGDGTLVIRDVKTTCGCTAASPDKREYAPGETGQIAITFDPTGPNEPDKPQKKYVNVVSNDPDTGVSRITITANVQAFIDVQPRMLMLGVLPVGEEFRTNVTIDCVDEDFVLESIRTTHPDVKANLINDGIASGPRTVEIVIPATTAWGPIFSWLEITARGRPTPESAPMSHTSRIRVQAQLFGELAAEPDTVRFGATPGETFTRKVRVYRVNGEPFQVGTYNVQSTELVNPEISVTQLAPDAYEVTLHATAGPRQLSVRGTIELQTDIAQEPVIRIPIVGVIRATAGGVQ